jgi:Zn-finger domain-containing protein
MDKVKVYNRILEQSRSDASRLAREAQERIELEEELKYLKLKKENLINKNHELDRELKEYLNREIKIRKHYYIDTTKTIILWDLFKYYMTTSENRRNNYSGPFPNLRPTLDSNQIKVFDIVFPKDIIQLLQENEENISSIENMKETLQYKLELENKRKNLHLKSNPAACGAVALNKKSNISLSNAASLLYVDYEEASQEKVELDRIEKPNTKKAKKFLELINK